MRQALPLPKYKIGDVLIFLQKTGHENRYFEVEKVYIDQFSEPCYALRDIVSKLVHSLKTETFIEHYYTKVKKTKAEIIRKLYG